jgi:hypothetical protein
MDGKRSAPGHFPLGGATAKWFVLTGIVVEVLVRDDRWKLLALAQGGQGVSNLERE